MQVHHDNNGNCSGCDKLFDRYQGFHPMLRGWFKQMQAVYPYFHISCAGRGYEDQMMAKIGGHSNALYGQSAHNYNAAIDTFLQKPGIELYDKSWYGEVISTEMQHEPWLEWYGDKDAKYPELPHIQVKNFKRLVLQGLVSLVEPLPS